MSGLPLDDPSFYEDFLVEAGEHFELIEQNFLALEEHPGDLDVLNAIFRSVHTIKGASGFLGLNKVQALAHVGENILDDLRKGRMSLRPEVMELLFETTDTLKVLVEDVGRTIRKSGEPADPDTSELCRRLEALKGSGAAGPAIPPATQAAPTDLPGGLEALDPGTRSAIRTALAEGGPLLVVQAEFQPGMLRTAFGPAGLLPTAGLVGNLVHVASPVRGEPTLETFEPESVYLDMVLVIRPSEGLARIKQLFSGFQNVTFTFHPLGMEGGPEPQAALPEAPAVEATPREGGGSPSTADPGGRKAPERGPEKGTSDTIRVSQAKLDGFMNTVAELIISKTMISHLVERLAAESRGGRVEPLAKELNQASAYLDQVSKEVQAAVLGIRMVPIRTIFSKFPRMIRDLAKSSGKKIELQIFGEDTEIDKSLIEELGDPLIHLIRNAADHGVEMPEARARAGKNETGTVVLRARHEGDSVIVEIEDDGKGIDPGVMRAKAVEKGLISVERADAMSDEEARELVFLPGFSTAKEVSDISGRGVGMDVVRSNVRKLNGNVSIQSAVGKGSIFTLRLPLTLAIIDALLMRAGGQVFALPGTSVEETILVPPATVASLTRRQAINLRGEVLGVTRLGDLLRFDAEAGGPQEGEELPVVVVSSSGRRMGLIVDAFLRRQEVVIKPLAPYLASLPGISGASIMGDGGVVLILDPSELMALATEHSA
ncbi:MAG: chemotaxis protein CheA [Acidobacteria bacterium]|nr:chemotaxis protein CheA [Acidobacteriota bacterium]